MQKRSQSLTLRRMKGSGRALRAGLVGTAAAVSLTACGDEPTTEVQAFRSVSQCVASGLFDEESCEAMLRDALQAHQEDAPRYAEEALCEEEFGQEACQYQQAQGGGGGYWMPFFTGWIVGSLASEVIDEVGDAFKKKQRKKYGTGSYYTQPFYRTANAGAPLRTLSGGALFAGNDGSLRTQSRALVSAPKAPPQVMTRTTVSSRGGFAGGTRFGGGFGS